MAFRLSSVSADDTSLALLETFGGSYTLGSLGESSLTAYGMRSDRGEEFSLLVPAQLPFSLMRATAFQDGAAFGYGYGDEMGTTPIQVVNAVHRDFCGELCQGGTYAWIVGYLLGCLTMLAENDRRLALVGMAHLCFLVASVPDCAHVAFSQALSDVEMVHNALVRVFRGRVRVFREQGVDWLQAQFQALSVFNGLP